MTFDWNLLITVLAGLGGVAVGGFVTWKIQERQLKHVDDNRFQEQRMMVYVNYMSNATKALSQYNSNSNFSGALDKYTDAYENVKIIASKKTLLSADEHFKLTLKIFREKNNTKNEKTIMNQSKQYMVLLNNFTDCVRKELKIDNFNN